MRTRKNVTSTAQNFGLAHELEIMDVKAAFHAAIKPSEVFSIGEFSTWPLLYQFEVSQHGHGADVLVKPDGYIRFHEKENDSSVSARDFFLEVDRSSETQETLVNRAVCYLEYYRSGGFAVRNGAGRDEFRDFPFRVLMVMKSAERRNNTAERLAQNNPPILTQVWLTTLAEVTKNPLGAIWILPKDYRDIINGTQFDTGRKTSVFGYRSRPGREAFVEAKIKKIRVLDA